MDESVFDIRDHFDSDAFRHLFVAQSFDIPAFENYLDNVLCLREHIVNFYEGGFSEESARSLSPYLQRIRDVCIAIAQETVMKGLAMKDFTLSFMTLRPPIVLAVDAYGREIYPPKSWVLNGRYDLFQNLIDFWEKNEWERYLQGVQLTISSSGATDILDILLTNGYEPPSDMLYLAAKFDKIDIVQRLVAWGMKATPITYRYPPTTHELTTTPLMAAIRNKNPSMIHILFLHGARVEDNNRYVHEALETRDEETLAALLSYGPDVNAQAGPDVNAQSPSEPHSLFFAVYCELPLVFFQMLVKAGADVNYTLKENGKIGTPLSYALINGHGVAAQYLRSVGAKEKGVLEV